MEARSIWVSSKGSLKHHQVFSVPRQAVSRRGLAPIPPLLLPLFWLRRQIRPFSFVWNGLNWKGHHYWLWDPLYKCPCFSAIPRAKNQMWDETHKGVGHLKTWMTKMSSMIWGHLFEGQDGLSSTSLWSLSGTWFQCCLFPWVPRWPHGTRFQLSPFPRWFQPLQSSSRSFKVAPFWGWS